MLTNTFLIICIIVLVFFLLTQIDSSKFRIISLKNKHNLPICSYTISNPKYIDLGDNKKKAVFNVKGLKYRYYREFPISFKFYSLEAFNVNIRIAYKTPNTDEIDIIYDKNVNFNNISKTYIYYIDDILVGDILIEIKVNDVSKHPIIQFEILQGNTCYLDKHYKTTVKF